MSDVSTNQRLANGLRRIAKYAYWILGIALVGGVVYYLYSVMQRPVAAVLVLVGGILALYFYYVKWFVVAAKNAKWPPYQTLCPDYLTPVPPGPNNAQLKCVDYVGVSTNGRFKVMDPKNRASLINRDDYAFPIIKGEAPEDLKMRLQTYGLSWLSLFGDD